nr:ThuA domain-containing protein [Pseudomonadota bacterium]
MSEETVERIEAYLVAGGRYHDIDFARVELLKLLAEYPHVRTQVAADYHDIEGIAASRFLVTYTCDLRPTPEQQEALHDFVASGGRWLALHGTNSILEFTADGLVAPKTLDRMGHTLRRPCCAHPPIQPHRSDRR